MLSTSRQLLLLLATLTAFVMTWVGGLESAVAAPIGMCGDNAESIAAPPPMFNADDAVLKACDSDQQEFQLHEGAPPAERVTTSVDTPDQKVVLTETVRAPRSKAYRAAFFRTTDTLPSEHRRRGLRPPQL